MPGRAVLRREPLDGGRDRAVRDRPPARWRAWLVMDRRIHDDEPLPGRSRSRAGRRSPTRSRRARPRSRRTRSRGWPTGWPGWAWTARASWPRSTSSTRRSRPATARACRSRVAARRSGSSSRRSGRSRSAPGSRSRSAGSTSIRELRVLDRRRPADPRAVRRRCRRGRHVRPRLHGRAGPGPRPGSRRRAISRGSRRPPQMTAASADATVPRAMASSARPPIVISPSSLATVR